MTPLGRGGLYPLRVLVERPQRGASEPREPIPRLTVIARWDVLSRAEIRHQQGQRSALLPDGPQTRPPEIAE